MPTIHSCQRTHGDILALIKYNAMYFFLQHVAAHAGLCILCFCEQL